MFNNRLPGCLLQTTTIGVCLRFIHSSAVSQTAFQTGMDSTPRRAVMYCPGDDLRKIKKGLSSNADCIILDCEDGVAVNRKQAARETIRSVLDEGGFEGPSRPSRPEVTVRVNSVDSGLCEDDMAAILPSQHPPSTVFLPKVESVNNLQWFAEKLDHYLKPNVSLKLVMYAESAKAIMDLPDICRAAFHLAKSHRMVPVGLVFGSDDLYASIGATRSVGGEELMYARQRLVLVAKAFGLQAIDMVHIQFKDLKSLQEHSEAGSRLGFTGKQVIHPNQIDTVQAAFLPSEDKQRWARDIVTGFNESQRQGKGAFVYNGNMVDMPLLRQAENIIRLSELDKTSQR